MKIFPSFWAGSIFIQEFGTIFSCVYKIKNMKSKKETSDKNSVEKVADLKKEAASKDPVQKGYNEKNPAQPEGAFKPDSKK